MKKSRNPSQVAIVLLGLTAVTGLAIPALAAAAPKPPSLYDLDIVEMTGRAGHEGLFPLQGQPIINSPGIVRTHVLGTLSNVTLLLRDGQENTISTVPMLVPPAGTTVPGTYFADITIPSQPFALSVSGQASSGTSLELTRPQGGVFSPQVVSASIVPTIGDVPAGVPILFTVQATNYGAAGTFNISFGASVQGTVSPTTRSVALAANGTASQNFLYTAPAGASFTADTFTATVASQTNPSSANTATLTLPEMMGPSCRSRGSSMWRKRTRAIQSVRAQATCGSATSPSIPRAS
jgi:hypothetical protein